MEAAVGLVAEATDAGTSGDTRPGEVHRIEVDRIEVDLAEVDAAMARLDDGSYGRCAVCGTVLDDDMLQASPTARSCPDHR